ncbi:MAG TPA: L-glyceraldehyde 3-phosphate reductase [Porphyromonadaceae bacterium]|jgi:L-glyceraldehyde 3-phosphate reductase|nr:L-glyceraldehyde 3-phosphate reductase [Porphyromonadaceae bacterium]HBX20055.1 L-glyceraldehyde 3-phosphate reductase [Porphyromonadaceae bacterium]HCM19195.1 L-glyceraldehyde 3-phosphate reductase [Porphyromonadaceae bacterium]
MKYNYCGKSGLQLPSISLGLWHNFGDAADYDTAKQIITYAFEQGITHFDLANNYGPPSGAAETNFGKIWKETLGSHRHQLIISSKAGHRAWDGPYGDGSSRKSLMASIDLSLKRTGLEYFDIFYSHRYDSSTTVEETMQALVDIVRSGKALYIGLSKYPPSMARKAMQYLADRDVPCLIIQDKYNMLHRKPEKELLPLCEESGCGFIAFSPLAQGILTDKYLNGIPEHSRAADPDGFLKKEQVTEEWISKVKRLEKIAAQRGQTIAQTALAWILRDERVTSLIIGARDTRQLKDNLKALERDSFSPEELAEIDTIFGETPL